MVSGKRLDATLYVDFLPCYCIGLDQSTFKTNAVCWLSSVAIHYNRSRYPWADKTLNSSINLSPVVNSKHISTENVGPIKAIKSYRERGGIAPFVLNLGTRWRRVQRHALTHSTRGGKKRETHQTGGWVNPEPVWPFWEWFSSSTDQLRNMLQTTWTQPQTSTSYISLKKVQLQTKLSPQISKAQWSLYVPTV